VLEYQGESGFFQPSTASKPLVAHLSSASADRTRFYNQKGSKTPENQGFTPKGTKNDRWVKADTGQAGKRESKRLPLSCFFSLGQKFCSQNG